MASFLNAAGERAELPLFVQMYQEAGNREMSLQGYLSQTYPTDETKYGTVFAQLCASEGIVVQGNRDAGLRPSTMKQILDGTTNREAGVTVKDAVPASRILFPAVFLQATEDKILADQTITPNAFEKMIAIDEAINGDRYEQPVINFDRPEAGRHQGIAQLARPAAMLTITAKDRAYSIPTFALGLEMSDQALRSSTLDLVTLSIARQVLIERNVRAKAYLLAALNGDVDNNEASLATLGKVLTTTALDQAATGGVVTQTAWMSYLMKDAEQRQINILVTDVASAVAIENRAGKPTVRNDNPTSPRIDTQMTVMNPLWPGQIELFIQTDPAWPAGTVMGLDKRYALRRVRNIAAEYSAIESYVMKRSQEMRFDFGEHITRLFTDAFQVLSIL